VKSKPEPVARGEVALGGVATSWSAVSSRIGNDRGRWLFRLADGRSAFVKAPYHDDSAEWLRREALVYQSVAGSFMPRLLAWDGEVLVLEDLSQAAWPPPWSSHAIAAVRVALDELARVTPPPGLPPLENLAADLIDSGWPAVRDDPQLFLSLGLCSPAWLDAALPDLEAAAASAEFGGEALVHADIRSDNLCLRDGQALFVDWNWASVGNPLFDLAAWLPSLAGEGGPPPEQLLAGSEGAAFAAVLAGFFCARAGRPAPPELPKLRVLQRLQAEPVLMWAARVLGLPPPERRGG